MEAILLARTAGKETEFSKGAQVGVYNRHLDLETQSQGSLPSPKGVAKRQGLELINQKAPSSYKASAENVSFQEVLFDARASVKVLTSYIARYLDEKFKNYIFRQIDSIHELSEWDPNDKPIQEQSYMCFLRTIILIKPEKIPSIGLSYSGNLLAAWINGKNKLILEFTSNSHVKWILTRDNEGEIEKSTGISTIKRINACLSPFSPEIWFKP